MTLSKGDNMNRSETITKLAEALNKAQSQMGAAIKDSKNPFFKSKYADLSSVIEACKEPLNRNGITILQPHVTIDGMNYVETLLLHVSGESLSSLTPIICTKANDPQQLGSAISYARRYGLQSLVSLPADDDDGEAAMGRTKPEPKAEPVVVKAEVKVEAPVKPKGFKRPEAKPTPAQEAQYKVIMNGAPANDVDDAWN